MERGIAGEAGACQTTHKDSSRQCLHRLGCLWLTCSCVPSPALNCGPERSHYVSVGPSDEFAC